MKSLIEYYCCWSSNSFYISNSFDISETIPCRWCVIFSFYLSWSSPLICEPRVSSCISYIFLIFFLAFHKQLNNISRHTGKSILLRKTLSASRSFPPNFLPLFFFCSALMVAKLPFLWNKKSFVIFILQTNKETKNTQ